MRSTPWITASVLALILGPVPLSAQQTGTIVGSVLDATSQRPLQSAQLFIPGTSVGAVTSEAGRFILLNVPAGTHTLRTILIGYGEGNQTVTVTAGGTAEIAIQLEPTAVALEGLVVTALCLERQARTLGVAAQQIDDDVLSPVAPSVVSSLSGQVAGVNITTATTQGGSSRIVLRGENSLLGDNQPLFVLDGVPLDNYIGLSFEGIVAGQGGYDYGTVINDIDPALIESITVLKGPNAAALYGSRAANGAIVIQTKKGFSALGGANITVSQTVTWEDVLRLPEFQNEYGQGYAGLYEYYDGAGGGVFDEFDASWGPPLDQGLMIPQFQSPVIGTDANGRAILEPLPWVSRPDNVENFFETGKDLGHEPLGGGRDRKDERARRPFPLRPERDRSRIIARPDHGQLRRRDGGHRAAGAHYLAPVHHARGREPTCPEQRPQQPDVSARRLVGAADRHGAAAAALPRPLSGRPPGGGRAGQLAARLLEQPVLPPARQPKPRYARPADRAGIRQLSLRLLAHRAGPDLHRLVRGQPTPGVGGGQLLRYVHDEPAHGFARLRPTDRRIRRLGNRIQGG